MTEFLHGVRGRTGFSGEFKLEMKSAFLPGGLGVKNLPTRQETGFSPWIGKIPWKREWQSNPIFLPGKSHGQRSLVGKVHGVASSRTGLND